MLFCCEQSFRGAAVFEVAPETVIPAGSELRVTIEQQPAAQHSLGKFRLSVAEMLPTSPAADVPERNKLVTARDTLPNELAVPVPLAMAVSSTKPLVILPAMISHLCVAHILHLRVCCLLTHAGVQCKIQRLGTSSGVFKRQLSFLRCTCDRSVACTLCFADLLRFTDAVCASQIWSMSPAGFALSV
jgi:hypothetical protein